MGAAVIVGAVLAAGASAYSAHEQRKEAKKQTRAQQRAIEQQQRQHDLQNRRERTSSLRAARRASAAIAARADAMGVGGSSSAISGAANTSAQFAGGAGFQSQMSGINDNLFQIQNSIIASQGRAAQAGYIGAMGQAIGGTMMTIGSAVGGGSPAPQQASNQAIGGMGRGALVGAQFYR